MSLTITICSGSSLSRIRSWMTLTSEPRRTCLRISSGSDADPEYTTFTTPVLPVSPCHCGRSATISSYSRAQISRVAPTPTASGWSDYLRGAERNRDTVASLGIVRSAEQLGGHSVLSLGPRRLVIAFDPATGSPDLLRTVLQLLRLAVLAAAGGQQVGDVRAAEEKITSALGGRPGSTTSRSRWADPAARHHHRRPVGGALHAELSRLLTQARSAPTNRGVGLSLPEALRADVVAGLRRRAGRTGGREQPGVPPAAQ